MKKYIWNILVAIDQFGNALTGGDPDETISSRSGKARDEGRRWGRWMCRMLNWFDPGHCDKTQEKDEGKDAVIPD